MYPSGLKKERGMTKQEKKKIRDILMMDVSWDVNQEIDPRNLRPFLEDLGIDDLGDVSDYLEGIREKLRELIK